MSKLHLLVIVAASIPSIAVAQVKTCKTGGVLFGNPEYKSGGQPAPTGSSAKSDPPLAWRTLTFAGKNVYTSTGQEVWSADLAGGNLRLVAGSQEMGLPKLADGPCANARFANVQGIDALPDGSLVVADNQTNSVLKIANPDDPAKCTVTYLAGTNKNIDAVNSVAAGDKDGPVGESKLGLPQWPVADGAGNVYFVDGSTAKVKKIAPDAAHTVTTVASLPRDSGIQSYRGLTLLKDKLYSVTNNFTTAFVFEADTKGGAVRKVLTADGKSLPEVGESQTPNFSALTNDGKDLYVTGSGYIWRVTTTGKTTHIAGAGSPLDYPKGYDPAGTYPAKQVILRYRVGDQTTLGSTAALAYHDGSLFYRGKSYSAYILQVDCR